MPEWNPGKDLTEEEEEQETETETETETKKHFLGRECGQRSLDLEHRVGRCDVDGRKILRFEGVGVVALVDRVRHLAVGDAIFSFGFTAASLRSSAPFYSSPRNRPS